MAADAHSRARQSLDEQAAVHPHSQMYISILTRAHRPHPLSSSRYIGAARARRGYRSPGESAAQLGASLPQHARRHHAAAYTAARAVHITRIAGAHTCATTYDKERRRCTGASHRAFAKALIEKARIQKRIRPFAHALRNANGHSRMHSETHTAIRNTPTAGLRARPPRAAPRKALGAGETCPARQQRAAC